MSIYRFCCSKFLIFVGSDALRESCIYLCSNIALYDIPHLCFSCTSMALHSKLVVRVYLHREVLARVDKFYEQWKLISIFLINLFAHKLTLVFVDKFNEVETNVNIINKSALYCYTLMTRHTTNLPRLTDVRLCGEYSLKWCYLIASPNSGFQIWFKLVWFHILIAFYVYKAIFFYTLLYNTYK